MTPLPDWRPLPSADGPALAAGWTHADRVAGGGLIHRPDGLPAEDRDRLYRPRRPLMGFDWRRPLVMGILNVTPDSFSDGGLFADRRAAVAQARRMVAEGADILDIGGESTRPGAVPVPEDEETARVLPVIAALRAAGVTVPISVDTRKAVVAQRALDAGASMVNDVSALTFDPGMAGVVARAGVPVCLMHAQGTPATMQVAPRYTDVTREVFAALSGRIDAAVAAGIARDAIIVDPGIGFGKTAAHNLDLLRNLAVFHGLGVPLLLGASRKRFIGVLSAGGAGEVPADERLAGSLAVALHAAAQGIQILRVHDTLATKQALNLQAAVNGWTG